MNKLNKYIHLVVGILVITIGIGAYSFIHMPSTSSGSSSLSQATTASVGGGRPRTTPDPGAANGPVPTAVYGQVPQGWHSGSGTQVTGTAADQASTVALAKFPGGSVNRVLQLSDGSYAVHILGTSGPHHIFVSTNFQVTGAA